MALAWTLHQLRLARQHLVCTHRIRAHNRRYYAGKHRHHGVNLHGGVTDPHGRLVWSFAGLPGSTQELTTAHAQGVFDVADRTELYLYADKGYLGGEGPTLLTPYNGPNQPDLAREANRCHTTIRTNAKPGFAVLKN